MAASTRIVRTETRPAEPPPPSEAVQVAMMLFAAAPVIGAVCSAPMVGGGLVTLATLDTLLILLGINY